MVKGVAYDGNDFSTLAAEALEVDQCRFDSVRFTNMDLRRSQLSHAAFTACDFASARTQDVSLLRSTVVSSRLTGSSWSTAHLRDVLVEHTRADSVMFRHGKFKTVLFRDCNLTRADFQFTEFRDVRFERCDLTGAQFANVTMVNVRFEDCTLIDVGGATSLGGSTVQGAGAYELAMSLAREAGIEIEP